MKKITLTAFLLIFVTALFFAGGCAATPKDKILRQLDAISGATKKR